MEAKGKKQNRKNNCCCGWETQPAPYWQECLDRGVWSWKGSQAKTLDSASFWGKLQSYVQSDASKIS